MSDIIQDLVKHAIVGDALKASEAFNDAIGERLAAAVDAKKIELAQTYFNQSDDEEEEEEEDSDDETEEEEEEEEEDENS
jgi:hypothetical protein